MVIEDSFYNDNGLVKDYHTEELEWNEKAIKELEDKYDIFYNPDCCTPVKVEGLDTENPILYLGTSDDGWLTIGNEIVFSAYYLNAFIEELKMIKQKINESKNI